MAKYRRGLVALSADPITLGHLDVIARARVMCESLIVLVANNDAKLGSYLFTLDERVAMTTRAVRDSGIDGVHVIGSSGLLTDVYLREGCDALFRGIRNEADRAYEESQTQLLFMILPELQGRVEYLAASHALRLTSSSMVKVFVQRHLDVSEHVPLFVQVALEERLAKQWKVAVTGQIGVGKSWVAAELVRRFSVRTGHPAHHVNFDELIRDVYDEDSPGAQLMREEMARLVGRRDILIGPDGRRVDRRLLARILFGDADAGELRERLVRLTKPHVFRRYREALAGKTGLIVVEWAQLAEMSMSQLAANSVIVVESPDRDAFLAERAVPAEQVAALAGMQWSADQKSAAIEAAIRDRQHGRVLRVVNRRGPAGVAELEALVGQVAADIAHQPELPPPSDKI